MGDSFDFRDGRGPVPAHKHANGGGWVADAAHVDASAYVGPAARVYGTARVYDDAQVYGTARVYDEARVYGTARVYDDARVYGYARVYDTAQVYGGARVHGAAQVSGGKWETSPLYIHAGCWSLTHSKPGHATVGCMTLPADDEAAWALAARRQGATAGETRVLLAALRLIVASEYPDEALRADAVGGHLQVANSIPGVRTAGMRDRKKGGK